MTELPLIVLTNVIHPDAVALLEPYARVVLAPDTQADTLRALAAEASGMIVRSKLPDDIAAHGPHLKGLVRHGVGLDFVNVPAATAAGIAVTNLPGSNTQAVAEYVFAALMALRCGLHKTDATLRAKGWVVARETADSRTEIGGSTLGILGVGAIGHRLATIGKLGFGMRVLGQSRSGTTLDGLIEAVDRETLFRESDAVVVACPLTEETRGLVDGRLIGLMKPGAVLINIARGPVVETAALMAALNAGTIAGAATDVFDVQPLAPDHPLFACPNLLLTPHVAGTTVQSMRDMGIGSAQEMLRILRGERPVNFVNPEAWRG